MELARLLGFIGDGATFFSGLLLSWDAIRAETEFVQESQIKGGLAHPVMHGVPASLGNTPVASGRDVEKVFRRRASTKAKWGTALLTLGFLLLFVSRLLEPTKIEIFAHHDRTPAPHDGAH